MSDPYLWLKWLHILSATVLFGTGIGTAFHMLATYLRREVAAIAVASRNTVLADWLFTATSGVIQPLTGAGLVYLAGYGWLEPWLVATYVLYAIAAACWAIVVGLQLKLRRIAVAAAATGTPLPDNFHRAFRLWFWLGWPAFLSLLAIFALMVMKPSF